MKSITAILTALALFGSLALVSAADSCCDKAKKDGKTCEHPCCVKAAKDGKVCEKCNKPKEEKKKKE
jgi:hypothetical protein